MSNKKIKPNRHFKMRASCNDFISGILEKNSAIQSNVNSHEIECNKPILSPDEAQLRRCNLIRETLQNVYSLSDIDECLKYIKNKFPRTRSLFRLPKSVSPAYHDVLPTSRNITAAVSQLETSDDCSEHRSDEKSLQFKRRNSSSNVSSVSFGGVNVPCIPDNGYEGFQEVSCEDESNMNICHEQISDHEQKSTIHLSRDDSNIENVHLLTSKNEQPPTTPPFQDLSIDGVPHEPMNYSEDCLSEILSQKLKVTTIQNVDNGDKISSVFQCSFPNEELKENHDTSTLSQAVVQTQNQRNIDNSYEVELIYEKICIVNPHELRNSLKNSPDDRSPGFTSQDESILNSFNNLSNNLDRISPSICFQRKNAEEETHEDIQNYSFEISCSELPSEIVSGQNISHELKNNSGASSVHSCKGNTVGSSGSEASDDFEGKLETLLEDENVQEISHERLKDIPLKVSCSTNAYEDQNIFVKKFVNDTDASHDLKNNSDGSSPLHASEDESIMNCSNDEQFNNFEERSSTVLPQDIQIKDILEHSPSEKSYSLFPFTNKYREENAGELNGNNSREKSDNPDPESECVNDLNYEWSSSSFSDKICDLPSHETAEDLCEELEKDPSICFSASLHEDENILTADNAHLNNNNEQGFLESSQNTGFTHISKEPVTCSEETSTTPPLQEFCIADIRIKQDDSIKKDCLACPSEYARIKEVLEKEPKIYLPEKNHSEFLKTINTTLGTREEQNEGENTFMDSPQDTVMHIYYENIEDDSNEKVKTSARSSPYQDFNVSGISHKELKDILNSASSAKAQDSHPQYATKHKDSCLDIHGSSESTFMLADVPASPVSDCLHIMPDTNDFKSLVETNLSAEIDEIFIPKNFATEGNVSDKNHDRDKQISVPVSNGNSSEENKSMEFLTCHDIKPERDEDVISTSGDFISKKIKSCNKRKLIDGESLRKCARRKHSEDEFNSIDTMNIQQENRVISNETCPDILGFVPTNSVLNISPSSEEVSISPGKCYPECPHQNYVPRNDLIFRLLEWDANWLRIQMETNCLPPIIDECKEVKNCYRSVEEYYDTYFPLNLLNIWLNMFNSWKVCPNAIHYDAKFENMEDNAHWMRISCSTIMTSNEFEDFPTHGGMIVVTFTKRDGKFEKLFGYMEDVAKHAYVPVQDNETFRKISWEKVTFSFYTAEKPSEYVQEFVKIQNLLNVENLLSQNDALTSLETSTMKDIILNPESNKSKIQVISCSSFSTFQKLQESVNKILNCISSEDSQVLLVHTSPSDRTYTVFRIVQGMIKKHYSVLVCFKDEKLFLMLATYLAEFGIILAVRESEVTIPDYLKKFVLNELIAQKMYEGYSRERIRYEVFKDCNIILTILSSMNLKDVSDVFFDGNSVCVLDEANLWYESETMLLLSYNLRKIVLMSNSTKQAEIHPFLQMYGYEKSLYSRLYKIKCCV